MCDLKVLFAGQLVVLSFDKVQDFVDDFVGAFAVGDKKLSQIARVKVFERATVILFANRCGAVDNLGTTEKREGKKHEKTHTDTRNGSVPAHPNGV